jgi:hypothetical protein
VNDITHLAELLNRRNAIDAQIAALIGHPALRGHLGEYIASEVFGIGLMASATQKGFDGRFRDGPAAGRTVNVKYYGKREAILDINPEAVPDHYLVLTGPASPAASSRGQTRPFVIDSVFLFDGPALVADLQRRGLQIGVATSVRQHYWCEAEIYPTQANTALVLTDRQRRVLALFGSAS